MPMRDATGAGPATSPDERRPEAMQIPDAVVFAVGEEHFRWEDVILSAVLRGDWAEIAEEARQGLASLARARAAGNLLPDGEVRRIATSFRYERELLSAEEMEAWLGRWSLTAGDWMAWAERSALRRHEAAATQEGPPRRARAEGLAEIMWAEAVCSGLLERAARELAERAAAAYALESSAEGAAPPGRGGSENPVERALDRDSLAAELARLGLGSMLARAHSERLDRIDRAFREFCDRSATLDAVESAVRAHGLEWTRLRCLTVRFPGEPEAREARLCVIEDGQALEDVARATGALPEDAWVTLEDAREGVMAALLAAEAGALLGPIPDCDGVLVVKVLERLAPCVADPDTRRRAGERVMRAAVAREASRHVRWSFVP
jgi:hypothetical protein